MSLRFSPNFMVTDPASAGFSVSGARNGAGNGSASDAGSGIDSREASTGYGLAPPDREVQPSSAGTGLTAPEDEGRTDSQPRYDLDYIQRVVQALGVDPDHFQFADGLGGIGTGGARMIPVGGGGGARAPFAEGTPFEPSVNPRAAGAFDALSNINPDLDITGTLEAYRNANDIGAYLNGLQAWHAVDAMKQSMGRMGIQPPSEADLGALQNWVKNDRGEAVLVYDPADLLERYRNALRMIVLERQGTIDIDRSNWTIKSIGKSRMTPEQFVQEVRSRYQKAFSEGVAEADRRIAARGYIFNQTMPLDMQRGIYADKWAKDKPSRFSESEGVPEGPGQVLAFGRWGYYQDRSGLHVQPDVLIDPGFEYRHILDGKATRLDFLSPSMLRQLEDYHRLGVPTVEATTPSGHILVSPRDYGRARSRK
jgi:hypothetical protein